MMSRIAVALSLAVALLVAPGPAPAQAPAARTPLPIEGMRELFQRVIVRPGATISPGPSADRAQPVAGFSVFYVYGRQGGDTGWVEVGSAADGRTQGWIPAAKTIEWRHAMVAAFTNPAGRKPVIFLDSERSERLLMLDRNAGALADEVRQAAIAGHPGPVLAMEPPNMVDISRNFYLLPILSADLVERESGPAIRLLKVISAPADAPAPPRPIDHAAALRGYKASVVFLIDTTSSMQPYIDETREALRSVVAKLGGTAVKDNFRFGVVAYRDSLEDNPGLEYPTKVFAKPDFSQPPEAVLPAMANLRESRVSSTGFDEDPIGGIKATLDEIDWSNLGGRFVILITDAGARPSTHPHSLTRLGIPEIKEKARAQGVVVMAIHLLTPAGAQLHDHEPARAQYEELTRFGNGGPMYYPVANGTPAAFHDTVETLVLALLQQVATATGVPVESLRLPAAPPSAARDRMVEQVRMVSEAMRLSYLGRVEDTRAPDVQTSWTTDRDLANIDYFGLEVRVLLTRNQLSDLANALQTILRAGLAGRSEPRAFFSQLRSAFTAAATDPQRIAQATRIGGLLGEYLADLPYTSDIMNITQDEWVLRGSIGQRVVLNNVEAKLRLYREFQAQTDLWRDITHSGQPGEAVFPVPIEALP